jgi:LPXTG-motif cell wall-anchored protein
VYGMTNHQKVLPSYSITFTTGLPAAGTCNGRTNTAKLLGDEGALLDDDTADVQLCTAAVIVSPPIQKPHPHVLPNTGGPDGWVFGAGLALVLAGGMLVLTDQRRRRRS